MKPRTVLALGCGVALLLFASHTLKADSHKMGEPAETASKASEQPAMPVYKPPDPKRQPLYKPPKRGKPTGRVGGGSRGIGEDAVPRILALVPEHVAQTAATQPSLFWYIDGMPQEDQRLVFTLTDSQSVEPIRESDLGAPAAAGVQRIRLSEHDVELEPGVDYEWSVAIVVDPDQRSRDTIASGWIDRVAESEAPRLDPQEGNGLERVNTYAAAGLWYDAMSSICDLIEENPDDATLLSVRASLLDQVGLAELITE